MTTADTALLQQLDRLSAPELRRLLAEHLTRQKLGLYWERDAIAHDQALNANVVLPRVVPEWGHTPEGCTAHANLIIEGDNFDSLRLLRATHAGKIRVIYIDPPYNTGNKDWVYNDSYVGANDRWRHSQWLEFLYQRLTAGARPADGRRGDIGQHQRRKPLAFGAVDGRGVSGAASWAVLCGAAERAGTIRRARFTPPTTSMC
jgi:hypothetical protein